MTPKKIWANFSVKDAARTARFYTQLGFKNNNTNNYPKLASFLFGNDQFIIHFFEQGSQIDEYLAPGSYNQNEIFFTLSAESESEVNEWANRVREAGGTVLSEPKRDDNDYYVFAFADPDGHKFNVLLLEGGM